MQALTLATKKEAEMVVETVVAALEATLLNNLHTDGFTLKLGSFGKLARSGKKVMQFLSEGRYVANVVNGKVNLYRR
jgi:hypothetical protein